MDDLLIRGATVVDGTGAPSRSVNVAVRGGRITSVGATSDPATTVVDADGLVLAPGFIDVHTHYDAQLLWDPTASPSLTHGTTTVIAGNCGYSLAPLEPSDDYVQRMMARVEGIPLEALRSGPPWTWSSFDEWMTTLHRRVALNVGFLVGHSTLRRFVMDDASTSAAATEAQMVEMEQILHRSLEAGALGFSTSRAETHVDGDGAPVPSRVATPEEVLRLSSVLRRWPGTSLQTIPDNIVRMSGADAELMIDMSTAARRPVNWNLLKISATEPDAHAAQLAVSDEAARRGGKVVALTLPQVNRLYVTLESGFLFDSLPGWKAVMSLEQSEKITALQDPAVLERLRRGAATVAGQHGHGSAGVLSQWGRLVVAETFSEGNEDLVGRDLADIAVARGQEPFDVLIDVAIRDGLRTGFIVPPVDDDDTSWQLRSRLWRDDRTVLGGSDAGAHVDLMCGASYTSTMLADAVRRRALISLEEAVRQMTDVPARLYGLRGRGRIRPGWHADLVLFDADEIGAEPVATRRDMPGDAPRLHSASRGIEQVWVNGQAVVSGGAVHARPGRVLRSGRDTFATELPAAR